MVVANGDLIMGDPDDDADYAFARECLSRLPVPCRYLPGNHDIGDNVISGKMVEAGQRCAARALPQVFR